MRTFQTIAPTSPAKMTPIDSTSWSTTPVAIVVATVGAEDEEGDEVEHRRPQHGCERRQHRVATTVAIELAASWKPLTKSNSEGDRDDQPEQDV